MIMNKPRDIYNELYKLRSDNQHSSDDNNDEDDSESQIENIEDEYYYSNDEVENQLRIDLEISELMNNSTTLNQFNKKYNELKDESLRKFYQRNQEIFNKYSQIDDSKESDEIDILTGEIITNNGHLDRISGNDNDNNKNIWRVDYNRYLKESEQELDDEKSMKKIVKKLDLFNGKGRNMDDGDDDDEVMKFSPTKGKVPSGLETEESPIKKRKLNTIIQQSVSDDDESEDDDVDDDTGDYYYESIIVNDRDKPFKLLKKKLDLNLPKLSSNNRPILLPNNLQNDISSSTESIEEMQHPLQNNQVESSSETEDFPSLESSPYPIHQKNSFDEEYQIIEDPLAYLLYPKEDEQDTLKIYQCAFKKSCKYCTGNKKLYEDHLLHSHSFQLSKLGYTISISTTTTSEESNIDGIDFINLFNDFPKKINLPKESKIFSCDNEIGINGSRCQKYYLNEKLLNEHKLKLDDCSIKKLVLFCPILGCGYMTDCGYNDWRNHMIESNHALLPSSTLTNVKDKDDDDNERVRGRGRIVENRTRHVNVDVPKFTNLEKKIDLKFIESGNEPTIDELFK